MLVDININIMDNDGNMVHHFEKRFSDEDSVCLESSNNNRIGESFESFLSEYMSFSGIMVRDKLISNSIDPKQFNSFSASDEVMSSGRGALRTLKNSEITYKISIGHRNVYVGKIPLVQKSNSDGDLVEEPEHRDQHAASLKQELEVFDHLISYTMSNAIAKYEANLYPTIYEEACEYPAADSSDAMG